MIKLIKQQLVELAYAEGLQQLKGNAAKSGPAIEKYLKCFREYLGQKNNKFKDLNIGYDWCCAYVYYLLNQVGYNLPIKPLETKLTFACVKTWFDWAIRNGIYYNNNYLPSPGDLVLFDHLIEDCKLDHIGVVLVNNNDHLITSEGNYHNTTGIFKRYKNININGYIKL